MGIRFMPRLALALAGAASLSAFADNGDPAAVVVTATRQPMRANELLADTEVIDRAEIERSGAAGLSDLLARKAGIQTVTNGGPGASTSVFIRGANAGHTLVIVDGMRIGSATTGQPTLETIPLELIDHVEIVRGPASALYGSDAIGGVIQIFTRRGEGPARPSAFVGAGSYGTARADAGVSGSSGDLSFDVRAGRYRSSGFDAMGQPPDADGFTQDYGSARLSMRLPRRGELTLSLLGSSGVNQYDNGAPGNTRADKKAQVATTAWRQPIGDLWTSTLQVGSSVDDLATHDSGYDSVIRTRRDQITWQNDVRLALGTALVALESVTDHVVNTGTRLAVDHRRTDSLVAGWTVHADGHRLQVNARRDDNEQYGGKTTGLLAYGYQFDDRWRAYASAASAFKAPTFNDLYWPLACYGSYGCFGGNPGLKPETAHNRELGLAWEGTGRQANLVYFDNRIRDLIVWGNQPVNVGSARIHGATGTLSGSHGAWSGNLSLTIQSARDQDTSQPLIRRPVRHLTAGIERSFANWTAGIDLLAVSAAEDTNFTTGDRVRLGGYALVGAFARYAIDPQWTLELRGDNLGDKRYHQALGFNAARATIFAGLRYAPK